MGLAPKPCAMELVWDHEANTPTMHTHQPKAEKIRNNLRRRRGMAFYILTNGMNAPKRRTAMAIQEK